MVAYQPRHRRGDDEPNRAADAGVESNSRLTSGVAVVLLVVLAVEGVTLLGVRAHLGLHVFLGMLVVPPVLLKIGSTTWRFGRYYAGSPAYRRKGPPPIILRLLGPLLVVLTVVLLASGVALVLAPHAFGGRFNFIHRASFVLWFGVMVIHVLGHILEVRRIAPRDWARRTRSQVKGATARQWAMVVSLVSGAVLGWAMLGPTSHYLHHG